MWYRGGELELLCVVGMGDGALTVLERVALFASRMDVHLTMVVPSHQGGVGLGNLYRELLQERWDLEPATCTVVELSGPERTFVSKLRELALRMVPDLIVTACESPRDWLGLESSEAWEIASEVNASLLLARPRLSPSSILALTDFCVGTAPVCELSAELGRWSQAPVNYLRAEPGFELSPENTLALAETLAVRRPDLAVLGLPQRPTRAPSALARSMAGSVLLVPLHQPLLH